MGVGGGVGGRGCGACASTRAGAPRRGQHRATLFVSMKAFISTRYNATKPPYTAASSQVDGQEGVGRRRLDAAPSAAGRARAAPLCCCCASTTHQFCPREPSVFLCVRKYCLPLVVLCKTTKLTQRKGRPGRSREGKQHRRRGARPLCARAFTSDRRHESALREHPPASYDGGIRPRPADTNVEKELINRSKRHEAAL